jgi:hypothetical protein
MINNASCCYNTFLDTFEIRKAKQEEVVSKQECKYGIELQFDINMKLIAIIIPEPDILFGTNIQYLKDFNCDNLT